MYDERLVREQEKSLQGLLELSELKESEESEHEQIYAQLLAQLRAVQAFIANMEEPWRKEKLRKKGEFL